MQYNAIEIITNQYLGPSEDTKQLLNAMNDLKNTQDKSLSFVLPMTREETTQYVEQYIYPKYDAVDAAITKIIAFADQKIQGLEKILPVQQPWLLFPTYYLLYSCLLTSCLHFGAKGKTSAKFNTANTYLIFSQPT